MEEKLSKTIVNYSLKIKENDRVLIQYTKDRCKEFVKLLIKDIILNKGIPFVKRTDSDINALLLENTLENKIKEIQKHAEEEVENYDCFIHIRYTENEYEEKNVPKIIRNKIGEATLKSREIRTNERRWILLNYPSFLDAYKAKMPYHEFYKYALEAMNVDYSKMESKIKPLKEKMEKTDKVRITGKNTDITFSIKGMNVVPCLGESNLPDGEIFTAPIKESVNGTITYNTPSPYNGHIFENVSLTFKEGKIVHATCNNGEEKLLDILNTDEGSRYVGEFSIGFNPYIEHPIGDILFDEKITGSIHFTPGAAYKEAYNGNDSSVHWDMVLIQREEYGGGNIYFDDVLIRENGKFVIEELKHLNDMKNEGWFGLQIILFHGILKT